MKQCAICDAKIDREDAPILTVGGYGIPRYLCDICASELDTATTSRDAAECADAIGRIGEKMANFDPDGATYKNVCAILDSAKERASLIAEGKYDFSLDEKDADADEDIPEELQESEEDRALDAKDEERQRKENEIFKWIYIGMAIGAVVFIAWKLLDTFLI